MNNIVVYTILSSTQYLIDTIKAVQNFSIPRNLLFVVINNCGASLPVEWYQSTSIKVLTNDRKLQLNQNIDFLLKSVHAKHYIRIDQDDLLLNSQFLSDIPDIIDVDLLICKFTAISTSTNEHIHLNHAEQAILYEPLGAGVAISRDLLISSSLLSTGLAGQDNFSLWLSLLVNPKYTKQTAKHNYSYAVDCTDSMSNNYTRIKNERRNLLRRASNLIDSRAWLYLFLLNPHPDDPFKYFKIVNNKDGFRVCRVWNFIAAYSFPRSIKDLLRIKFARVFIHSQVLFPIDLEWLCFFKLCSKATQIFLACFQKQYWLNRDLFDADSANCPSQARQQLLAKESSVLLSM